MPARNDHSFPLGLKSAAVEDHISGKRMEHIIKSLNSGEEAGGFTGGEVLHFRQCADCIAMFVHVRSKLKAVTDSQPETDLIQRDPDSEDDDQ